MATIPAATGKSIDLDTLHEAVENIDTLSQHAFSDIAALATLALEALESPSARIRLENIASALRVIRDKASDTERSITCEAQDVGCQYVDQALARRWAAQATAKAAELCHA